MPARSLRVSGTVFVMLGQVSPLFDAVTLRTCLLGQWPEAAEAVPSYAVQTGQPCAACHVGAFGPQLRQLGRDFKLYGYVSNDTHTHFNKAALILSSASSD